MKIRFSLSVQLRSIFLLLFVAALAGCGGGSSDGTLNTIDTDQGEQGSETDNGIECQRVRNVSELDLNPVYAFEGLWSNWENGEDLAGYSDMNRFTDAFSNLTAVAYESNDNQLKSTLVDSLYNLASQDAFLGTKLCYRPGANCTAWNDPAGYDVSDGQSYNFVLLNVETHRMIYSYLADWATENKPEKHNRIAEWFQYWEETMPQPEDVYFGLGTGFYQWKIQQLRDKGEIETARNFAASLTDGIESRINEDGSVVDRTTRGDRALWYHHTALNEIMGSVRIHRILDLGQISFDGKLHNAVDIFVKTIENPSHILPWASISHNNAGDGTAQQFNNTTPNDFTNWYHSSSNGTWFYIYMNEYPNHSNTIALRRLIPLETAASAYQDNQFFPLGCMLF